jgi:hypothetical protein
MAWGCAVLLTYSVWEIARLGGRWVVPIPVLAAEYGIVLVTAVILLWRLRQQALPAAASVSRPGE